jgi:hypothetical protein
MKSILDLSSKFLLHNAPVRVMAVFVAGARGVNNRMINLCSHLKSRRKIVYMSESGVNNDAEQRHNRSWRSFKRPPRNRGTALAKSDYKKLTRFAQGDRGLTPAARLSALYVDF